MLADVDCVASFCQQMSLFDMILSADTDCVTSVLSATANDFLTPFCQVPGVMRPPCMSSEVDMTLDSSRL